MVDSFSLSVAYSGPYSMHNGSALATTPSGFPNQVDSGFPISFKTALKLILKASLKSTYISLSIYF